MVVGCRHVVGDGDGAFGDDAMGDDAKDGHDGADDNGDHSGGNDVDGDERDLLLVVGSPNFDLYIAPTASGSVVSKKRPWPLGHRRERWWVSNPHSESHRQGLPRQCRS